MTLDVELQKFIYNNYITPFNLTSGVIYKCNKYFKNNYLIIVISTFNKSSKSITKTLFKTCNNSKVKHLYAGQEEKLAINKN